MITVVDADLPSVNASVASDREIIWHISVTVVLENNLAFQESSLWDARVDLLGLSDHDRLVLKIVEDGDLSDAEVLKAAFHNVLFEEAVESKHLKQIITQVDHFCSMS